MRALDEFETVRLGTSSSELVTSSKEEQRGQMREKSLLILLRRHLLLGIKVKTDNRLQTKPFDQTLIVPAINTTFDCSWCNLFLNVLIRAA